MKKRIDSLRDLGVEISFLEGLRARMPEDTELLKLLGDDYTRAGRVREGLEIDQQLSFLLPTDPLVHFNLACSYSLADRLAESAEALRRAIGLGYREWKWLREDPDLEKLRCSPEFVSVEALIESHVEKKS